MHGFVARAKQKDIVFFHSPDHLKSVGLFCLFRDVTETHEQIKHQSTTLSSCHVVLLFILLVTQRRRSDSAKYNLVLDMSSLLHSSINTWHLIRSQTRKSWRPKTRSRPNVITSFIRQLALHPADCSSSNFSCLYVPLLFHHANHIFKSSLLPYLCVCSTYNSALHPSAYISN